jgi:hypothetical protein
VPATQRAERRNQASEGAHKKFRSWIANRSWGRFDYAVMRRAASHTYVLFSSGGSIRLIRAEWIDAAPDRFIAAGPADLAKIPHVVLALALMVLPCLWGRGMLTLRRLGPACARIAATTSRHARPMPRVWNRAHCG